MAKAYLYQARDSVTGTMHHWVTTSASGSTGYPGANTAEEKVCLATHGSDAGGGEIGDIAASDVFDDSNVDAGNVASALNQLLAWIVELQEKPPFPDSGPLLMSAAEPTATVTIVVDDPDEESPRAVHVPNFDVDLRHVTPFDPGTFMAVSGVYPMLSSSGTEHINGWAYVSKGSGTRSRVLVDDVLSHRIAMPAVADSVYDGGSVYIDCIDAPPVGTTLVVRFSVASEVAGDVYVFCGFFSDAFYAGGGSGEAMATAYAGLRVYNKSPAAVHSDTFDAEGMGDDSEHLYEVRVTRSDTDKVDVSLWEVTDGVLHVFTTMTTSAFENISRVGVTATANALGASPLVDIQFLKLRIGPPDYRGHLPPSWYEDPSP